MASTSWSTSATGSVASPLGSDRRGVEHVDLEVAARARRDADGTDRLVAAVDEALVEPRRADDEPAGGRLRAVGGGGDVLVRAVVEEIAVVADALPVPGRRRARRGRSSARCGRCAPSGRRRAIGPSSATTAHSAETPSSEAMSWRGPASELGDLDLDGVRRRQRLGERGDVGDEQGDVGTADRDRSSPGRRSRGVGAVVVTVVGGAVWAPVSVPGSAARSWPARRSPPGSSAPVSTAPWPRVRWWWRSARCPGSGTAGRPARRSAPRRRRRPPRPRRRSARPPGGSRPRSSPAGAVGRRSVRGAGARAAARSSRRPPPRGEPTRRGGARPRHLARHATTHSATVKPPSRRGRAAPRPRAAGCAWSAPRGRARPPPPPTPGDPRRRARRCPSAGGTGPGCARRRAPGAGRARRRS